MSVIFYKEESIHKLHLGNEHAPAHWFIAVSTLVCSHLPPILDESPRQLCSPVRPDPSRSSSLALLPVSVGLFMRRRSSAPHSFHDGSVHMEYCSMRFCAVHSRSPNFFLELEFSLASNWWTRFSYSPPTRVRPPSIRLPFPLH